MTPDEKPTDPAMQTPRKPMPGQFFVRTANGMSRVMTAREVMLFVESGKDHEAEIFCIHRIAEDGRMELVGISPEMLMAEDCCLLRHADVRAARSDFDAIVQHALASPPPCHIDLELAHVDASAAGLAARPAPRLQVVALLYPAACTVGVMRWLQGAGELQADHQECGPDVLKDYLANLTHVVMRQTLEPISTPSPGAGLE